MKVYDSSSQLKLLPGYHVEGLGINPVLDFQDSPRKRLFGVAGLNGDRFLEDDRAGIQALVDEVHGGAGPPNAGLQRLPLGVHPGKRREKGWVNIENGPRKSGHERRGENSRVAGQANNVDAALSKGPKNLPRVVLARQAPTREEHRLDTGAFCHFEGPGPLNVDNYQLDSI